MFVIKNKTDTFHLRQTDVYDKKQRLCVCVLLRQDSWPTSYEAYGKFATSN